MGAEQRCSGEGYAGSSGNMAASDNALTEVNLKGKISQLIETDEDLQLLKPF